MALLEEVREESAGTRVRTLVVAAVGPLVVGYSAVAAVFALVAAVAPLAAFSTGGVLAAALPGWLAAYQVPLVIQGGELGALPLLPTLLVALLVGRVAAAVAARTDARGLRETGRIVIAVVVGHAAAGLTLALLVRAPVAVDPLAGFYYPALIAGLACVVALARRSEVLALLTDRVDDLALRGLRAGALACAALVFAGALVVVVGLATSVGTVRSLFVGGAGASGGLLLLSLGYLPNAVVAGVGFVAGPGFGLGAVSVAPLGFSGGAVPAVPLLGALPEQAQPWWPVLFALPLAVGLGVGWVLREVDESPVARLRSVSVAAVVVAVAFAVLAGSAGGALGGGPVDPLDLRAALLSLTLVGWIGLPGALVAWFAGPHPVAAGLIGPDSDDAPDDDAESDDDPSKDAADSDNDDDTDTDRDPGDDRGDDSESDGQADPERAETPPGEADDTAESKRQGDPETPRSDTAESKGQGDPERSDTPPGEADDTAKPKRQGGPDHPVESDKDDQASAEPPDDADVAPDTSAGR